ncbi:LLM class flavin-dependent oxidoreductase [Streptomyces sp. NPDC001027]|uniref:LLM class flavin-dependent oxidoreductase n=1 Tax=Streptomyces sp. NPDC001027 TaxID=3154771 RepID=UPI0033292E0C
MKTGMGLPCLVRSVRPEALPMWANRAEASGFSSLGADSCIAYPSVTDTMALAAVAGATRTIRLISNVVVEPCWPPVVLAKELAGIQSVSGGRLTLGVGIGGRSDDFMVEDVEPLRLGKRMEDALEIFRDFCEGEALRATNRSMHPLTGSRCRCCSAVRLRPR